MLVSICGISEGRVYCLAAIAIATGLLLRHWVH